MYSSDYTVVCVCDKFGINQQISFMHDGSFYSDVNICLLQTTQLYVFMIPVAYQQL